MKFTGSVCIVLALVLNVSGKAIDTLECYNSQRERILGISTARECCLGDGYSYRLGPSGEYVQCIVHGFKETTIRKIEGKDASIGVHFGLKGLPLDGREALRLNIHAIPGTADPSDYRLRTTRMWLTRDYVTVHVDLLKDSIALEGLETFQVQLRPESAADLRPNEFLRDNVNVEITDDTRVTFQFLETEYASQEESGVVAIGLQRSMSVQLATDLALRVTPLTYREADDRGITIPLDVPVAASRSDFDNNPSIGIFYAASSSPNITVSIPITDDEINEPEEGFVVMLEVTSAVDPDLVALSVRSTALCRIHDDDGLAIGFERAEYTFNENDGTITDAIALVKNGPTEQTFFVTVAVVPSPAGLKSATIEKDFTVGHTDAIQRLTFWSHLQRVYVPFSLHNDALPEGTEAFKFVLSRDTTVEDSPEFDCDPYKGCLNSALVKIRDTFDCIFEFEHAAYTVSEEDGLVQVCAVEASGTCKDPTHIILTTVDGSATNPTDYSSRVESYTLGSSRRKSCMTVTITNDESPEIHEDFIVTMMTRDSDPRSVVTTPNTTITITDDDVEPEPEKGCTVEVFVLAAMHEEQQMAVVNSVQTVLPSIFTIPLATEVATGTMTEGLPHSTEIPPSTVRNDPVLSVVYTSLVDKFDKVDSDTGYIQFVEAVTEITEAHQEACSGPLDEQASAENVSKLARQFAALTPSEGQELRSIFGRMLCLKDNYSAKRKRQASVDSCGCPRGGFDAVESPCQFFTCLDKDVEERFDKKLEAVFGFIVEDFPCLAFVVDTTGSMREEIDAVKDLIETFVSSEGDEPACYSITPFNDNHGYYDYPFRYGYASPPGPDYGPATVYDTFEETDLLTIREDISNLMAYAGGDGPEYGMHGLQTALQAQWPWGSDAMVEGSQVILFTDNIAKDTEIMKEVIDEACERQVCVHLFLSTSKPPGNGFDGYTKVAEETGGTIVRAQHTEFHDLVQIFGDFSTSYRGDTPCLDFYKAKSERGKRSSEKQCQSFTVSTFTSVLKLLITTEQLQVTIQKPSGVKVTNSTVRGYAIYRELHPEPGEWSVCVQSGTLTVSFNSRVLLDFVVAFVNNDESSPAHVASTTVPPPACSSGRVAVLSSRLPDISLARLNFVRDGEIAASASLTPCSKAMVGNATFPSGSVTYQLQGEDLDGNPFEISGKTVDVKPGSFSLNVVSSIAELRPGESTALVFELHNQNSYGSTEFTISVETPTDFSVALQETHAVLEAGGSAQISIQVLANSLPGVSNDIAIVANDGCTTVTATHTLTIVPLDFTIEYAVDDICSTSTMTTSATPPACSSGDFAVLIPTPIPGISFTHLSFVQHRHTAVRNALSPCSDIGALVGSATFPLGVVTYQLHGKDAEDNRFSYDSSSLEFRRGRYALTATSTAEELDAGEHTFFVFELHNNNLYGSASFSVSTGSERGLSAVPQQGSTTVTAGSSTEIRVRVSAGSSFASQSKQFTLTVNDGCTSVTISHTVSITAPEIPTAEPDLCGCENGGTCISVTRRGREHHFCRCRSGYGGRLCQIELT